MRTNHPFRVRNQLLLLLLVFWPARIGEAHLHVGLDGSECIVGHAWAVDADEGGVGDVDAQVGVELGQQLDDFGQAEWSAAPLQRHFLAVEQPAVGEVEEVEVLLVGLPDAAERLGVVALLAELEDGDPRRDVVGLHRNDNITA